MKKYRLLTCLLASLILLLSFGCVRAFRYSMGCAGIKSGSSFTFLVASDLHYLSKELYDNGNAFNEFLMTGDGKLVQYTDELTDAFFSDVKLKKPDFLIISGDLTCNGEKKSHLRLAEKLEAIEDKGICVFVVPGNHDIENPLARSYIENDYTAAESISSEEYLQLYSSFGYDNAVSRDADSLSYLAMPTEDTWLLMLDSSDHSKSNSKQPAQKGSFSHDTIKWIENCAKLAESNGAGLIAVMHHSLLDHSRIMNEGYTLENSEEVLKVFERCGIKIIMSGHIHIQDIKSREVDGGTLYDAATSSLSVYPHQYGTMQFTPGEGYRYETVLLDIDKWMQNNQTGKDFPNDFRAFSADCFVEQCCRLHKNCLSKQQGLPKKDMDAIFRTVADMNLMYFAGFRNEALAEITNSEGFGLLKDMPSCFTKEYSMSMLEDERADNNRLFIPCANSR